LRKDLKNLKSSNLIIIDYSSKRFDPIIFTKKIKSFSKDAAVILIMGDRKRAAEAYKVGADDYIIKPLNLERLHKSVKNIKHRREQT
jgi:DNA-binding NtrC family response regulator